MSLNTRRSSPQLQNGGPPGSDRGGSYVPQPMGPPGFGPPPGASPPGGNLSGALPDPEAIARQKEVYLKMLDEQLNQGLSVLDQQVKYQRDYLQVQVEQQKRQFMLQLEQQMKAQDMALTQQYNEQLMALQLQAGNQKAALEQQAMQLSMEYEQRRAEESMYRQQYDIQRQQMEMAVKMSADYERMGPLGAPQPPPDGSYAPAMGSGNADGGRPWGMTQGLEQLRDQGSFPAMQLPMSMGSSFRGPAPPEPAFRPPETGGSGGRGGMFKQPEIAYRPPALGDSILPMSQGRSNSGLPPEARGGGSYGGSYAPEVRGPGPEMRMSSQQDLRSQQYQPEVSYRPPIVVEAPEEAVYRPASAQSQNRSQGQPMYRNPDPRDPRQPPSQQSSANAPGR